MGSAPPSEAHSLRWSIADLKALIFIFFPSPFPPKFVSTALCFQQFMARYSTLLALPYSATLTLISNPSTKMPETTSKTYAKNHTKSLSAKPRNQNAKKKKKKTISENHKKDLKETEKNIYENEEREIFRNWGRPKRGRKKRICLFFCAGKIEFISYSYSQWSSWTGDLQSVKSKTEIIETGKQGIKNYRNRNLSSGKEMNMEINHQC